MMSQLRAFVTERLSAAAGEILVEFEKTLAVYDAEVTRCRDVVDGLQKQLELLRDRSAAETPPAQPLPSTPVEMEQESNFSVKAEAVGPSQTSAGVEGTDWRDHMSQTDPKISQVKEEQEELDIDSQNQGDVFLSPVTVKSEQNQNQSDTEVTPELEPLSSDCSAAQSENSDDEDWMESKGAQRPSKKRKGKARQRQTDSRTQEGREVFPHEESSAKSQPDDRSFCHLCGKAFKYIGSLMKHIKIHDMTADCDVCQKTYQSTEELIRHLQSAHSKAHFCDVCGKTFTKYHFLRVHSKIHKGLKQFTCQDCGKIFLRKEHLTVHARTHSGEKPYCCDICGKAFSQSQNLTIHKRSHTGEKPYHCHACGKVFSTSGHLKTHMRYHSGEKPYSCDICGKHFRQSVQVMNHKRIHTGERPNGCHVCGMQFSFGANLKVHMKIHEK